MKNIFVISIIILCLISCTIENDEIELIEFSSDYFPLNIGNTWFYDSLQQDISPWRVRTISDTLVINDTVYYIYRAGDGVDIIDTIRADENGNIVTRVNNRNYLWFDFEADSGITYNTEIPYILGETVHYVNMTVSKPAIIQLDTSIYANTIEFYQFLEPQVMDVSKIYNFSITLGLIRESWLGASTNMLHAVIIDGDTLEL